MEVKDANAALLSNFEVYQLLTDLKQQRKESGKNKQSSGQQNLNTIMYETLKYISKTPCRYQSPETVRDFLITMKGHKLTNCTHFCLLQTELYLSRSLLCLLSPSAGNADLGTSCVSATTGRGPEVGRHCSAKQQ
ncbi:DNA-directed RNA polymerase III subunit RPC9 isoform X3 [Dromaius novaehollandiae]|uniref:DNA-directed RNA polymerase III subunit RPC9 isoform X3 n=1 Tax=Dromaius novaehollandiae TaxID=8790 RepID=UPI000E1EAB2C|nr:DNA-directed RNA polymerase III subunit RPC9 isoform X3 [Dromaius novaehollandiae]